MIIYYDSSENKYNKLNLAINLSFFADGEDKTEKATPKKKERAREEGQVAKSVEIGTAFLFIASFMGLKAFSGYIYENLKKIFSYNFALLPQAYEPYSIDVIGKYASYLFLQIMLITLPMFLLTMIVGVLSNILQIGWHPTMKPLKPKFSKINPISGFKRLFSFKALIELAKSVIKLVVIGFVIYDLLSKEQRMLFGLLDMSIMQATVFIGNVATRLGITVGMWYLVIALSDFVYQKLKHAKELRMTKQEVKEEYKSTEGNPQIKGQIRQRMREASMRRMMQDIPNADVIITNPTHFAVALKYDRNSGTAPKVVAKGADHLAKRIKEVAEENKVIIVENKPLARTLYSTVDIGAEIPPELYKSVAEILAYVYKLKNIA